MVLKGEVVDWRGGKFLWRWSVGVRLGIKGENLMIGFEEWREWSGWKLWCGWKYDVHT